MLEIFFRFSSLNLVFVPLGNSYKIARCCQKSPRVANLVSNYEFPNLFSVRDTTIFLIFQSFSENSNYKIILIIWNSQTCSWVLSENSQGLRILPPSMNAQILVVFEIWRALWFNFNFSENSNYKKILNFENLNPVVGCCPSILKDCASCLQIWLLNFW